MMSASRAGSRESVERYGRRYAFQSGMIAPRDEPHGVDEGLPRLSLPGEHATTFRRQLIEAAPALAGLLDPLALEPSALLEAVEEWIQGREVEFQLSGRACLDQLAELVAVPGAPLDDRQDD